MLPGGSPDLTPAKSSRSWVTTADVCLTYLGIILTYSPFDEPIHFILGNVPAHRVEGR